MIYDRYTALGVTTDRALYIVLIQTTEKISFNFSLKNILFPDKSSYTFKLMEKIESVIKRIRWKTYFYLNKETQEKPLDSNPGTTRHNATYLKNLRKMCLTL